MLYINSYGQNILYGTRQKFISIQGAALAMSTSAAVTIIIPNYKTLELTKLCLRSLRKYTDCSRIKVLVVDNNSNDESVEYLRKLKWITLLERDTTGENGPQMHAKALDMAMEHVDTEYVMVIHTDTIVLNSSWLDFMLGKIQRNDNIAAVGSWKLEHVPALKAFFKRWETAIRRMLGRKVLDREHYFRSHCALYKSSVVRESRGFYDGESAGISLFNILREKGYELPFIESEELCRYMAHLNHATMILNPREGDRKTAKASAGRKLKSKLRALNPEVILADDSLDD